MSRSKIGVAVVFAFAGLAMLIPAGALAAHTKGAHTAVVFGTVASTGTSTFDVTTASGAKTVNTNKNTKFVVAGDADADGFTVGDAVWARSELGKKHASVASKVEYADAAFAIPYGAHTFKGTFVSYAAPNLTIKTKKAMPAFDTTTATYRVNGKKASATTANADYATSKRITVYAREYTDSSWHATRVFVRTHK